MLDACLEHIRRTEGLRACGSRAKNGAKFQETPYFLIKHHVFRRAWLTKLWAAWQGHRLTPGKQNDYTEIPGMAHPQRCAHEAMA